MCAGGDDDRRRGGELHLPGDDGRELHGDVQRVRTGAEHDDLRHGGVDGDGGAAPALTVTKSATPAVLVVGMAGQVYTITISVANGPTTAAINVSDVLPAGVTHQWSDHGDGRDLGGCPAGGATSLAGCTVASGTNGPVVITVPVAVAAEIRRTRR